MATDNRILKKLLDRLFAALVNGPSLNCRPHSSRQRIDLLRLAALGDETPEQILRALLGADREIKVSAKMPQPRGNIDESDEALSPERRAARQAFREQQGVIGKLRTIAEDARTYENDTGVHVLQIGFPLLSLPPGRGSAFGLTRRVIAPLAFVSLSMSVKAGPTPGVVLECRNEGADLVVPNTALLSWLEQQTGQPVGELFDDDTGEKPWAEIAAIAERVCKLANVAMPSGLTGEAAPEDFKLVAAPRSADDEDATPAVLASAVVGLFPMANQGLLRDMQALANGEPATGPIESFIRLGVSLDTPTVEKDHEAIEKRTRTFGDERLVTVADPCQARAVRLARTSRGLVVHGPPGTGKSQTIANVIGDHLARGERVLFVCDKRTALDVVMNRLDGLGLGSLCAVVHDAQRDQRELYKSIREQIDTLTELKTDASADGTLVKTDIELQKLHDELTAYHVALMKRPDKDTLSFHELMGRWLSQPSHNVALDAAPLDTVATDAIETHAQALVDLTDRAAKVGYATNPWTTAAGMQLDDFLTTPLDGARAEVNELVATCEMADTQHDPATPPLPPEVDLDAVAAARVHAADVLANVRAATPADLRLKWASVDISQVRQAASTFATTDAFVRAIESSPLDRELLAITHDAMPSPTQINTDTATLDAYLEAAESMLGFLAFGKKSAAAKVLTPFGLQPTAANAERVKAFLGGIKSRLMLRHTLADFGWIFPASLPDDVTLLSASSSARQLIEFVRIVRESPALADVCQLLLIALSGVSDPIDLLRGLRATPSRVAVIRNIEKALAAELFSETIRHEIAAAARVGATLGPRANALLDRFDTLENVLRVRSALVALPSGLRTAAAQLASQNVSGDIAVATLRHAADGIELTRRLKANRQLTAADDQKLRSSFARYQQLDGQKKSLARQAILHLWGTKQKSRLLHVAGMRVTSLGADLRRRLITRGERAMRLRQVVQMGHSIEGGDPLYDLRPVWMASPETVAQLFPRQPVFDVVIFDEASQCRLEEALPVLLRAKRVVIAGDPKQLPPTRFFESAVATSDEEDVDTDQQLFESQQGEIEDLLAAALNVEIDECYLDVHYRSRNSDLIEFSNDHFYGSRLQAIPAHPRNRTRFAPLTLYKANGTYEKRSNLAEAEKVCQIVRDLLKRAEPPSIGIACFNITQRDLIVERLEELADEDATFAEALAAARERRTANSFEGLFVKNLENVQGDERDHLIISTTYGPDSKGKFYRRFGPVGSAGGGRRLNVLVTRARSEVHLVTSIPETVYRNLPPIPPGETPGGAWLLFAYLVYAEGLASKYEFNDRLPDQTQAGQEAIVNIRPTRFPSAFSQQFAERLHADNKIGSDVHWGNDGFCVDLALHHPQRSDDVTTGVLCDLNRFEQAADPVEWEVFRTSILEGQGWTLSRVWTPHFFRDPHGVTNAIAHDAEAAAAAAPIPDAIRTTPST